MLVSMRLAWGSAPWSSSVGGGLLAVWGGKKLPSRNQWVENWLPRGIRFPAIHPVGPAQRTPAEDHLIRRQPALRRCQFRAVVVVEELVATVRQWDDQSLRRGVERVRLRTKSGRSLLADG